MNSPASNAPEGVDTSSNLPSLTRLASWLFVAKIISFGLSLALPLLLVRRLSQEEFGLYKQAFLVVGTAIAILPLGFQMSAYYFLPREPLHRGQVIFNILLVHGFATSLGLLALLMFPSVLNLIFNSSDLMPYAPQIGTVILLWGVAYFLETAVVANQEAQLAAALIIAAQFSRTVLMVTAAAVFATVQALIYAAIFQGVVQTAILLAYLNWRFPGFWRHFEWSLLRRQLSYALPFGLAGLLYTLEVDYHNYFVSNHFGPANFAIYSVGCLDIPLITLLGESVSSVVISRVSTLQRDQNHREIILLMAKVTRKLALAYLPIYAFLMVAGREFITAIFTVRYAESWPLFAANLTMVPFAIFLTDPVVRAYTEQRHYILKLHAVLFVLLLASLPFATRSFGMLGAVFVIVGINLLGKIVTAHRLARMIGLQRGDAKLLRGVGMVALAAAVAALVTALVKISLPPWKPLYVVTVCGVCYALSYLAAALLMRIPEADERALVIRFLTRAGIHA